MKMDNTLDQTDKYWLEKTLENNESAYKYVKEMFIKMNKLDSIFEFYKSKDMHFGYYMTGYMHITGKGIEKDYEKGINLIIRSCKEKVSGCELKYYDLEYFKVTSEDFEEMIKLYIIQAENNDVHQYYLGNIYEMLGDLDKAEKYYLKSANNENADAQHSLGKLYDIWIYEYRYMDKNDGSLYDEWNDEKKVNDKKENMKVNGIKKAQIKEINMQSQHWQNFTESMDQIAIMTIITRQMN